MNVAFVHHAEKKKGSEDPELTHFGIEQTSRVALFLKEYMNPQHIWYTQTKRTHQTAMLIQNHFPNAMHHPVDNIPDQWNEWISFANTLSLDNHCIVCHHTTIQMCKKQLKIPLFLSCFSSVIILKRITENEWKHIIFRQGEVSL